MLASKASAIKSPQATTICLRLLATATSTSSSSTSTSTASSPSSSSGHSKALVKKRGLEGVVKYGPGGRSSVAGYTATVLGSTSFVSRYLVNRLGKQGVQTVIPYRGDELEVRYLRVMGDVGQIVPQFFTLKDYDSVYKTVKDSEVVFNLIGRDYETNNFPFKETHVEGARRIGKACREAGVTRLVHVSALGASHDSPSAFLRSKAEGEEAIKAEFPDVTIVRPSTIFGAEDRFLSRIAYLNMLPLFYGNPVVKNGQQLLQPVYVTDVAQGLLNLIKDTDTIGKTYEFVGPKKYTYEQLVRYFGEVTHRHVQVIPYPEFVLKTYARLMELWPPSPVISSHDITRMTLDEVPEGLPNLENLGMKLTSLENVILTIWRTYRPAKYLDEPTPEPFLHQQQKN